MAKRKFDCADEFEEWLDDQIPTNKQVVWSAGNWSALYDAVAQALDDDEAARQDTPTSSDPVTVPRWVLEAIRDDVLPDAMRRATRHPGAKGRTARWRERWRQDQIDWHRFRQVWYRRLARRDDSPPSPRGRAAATLRVEHHRRAATSEPSFPVDMHTPYPWDPAQSTERDDLTVFEAVAQVFTGSIYGGSADAMRKSYERVQKALKQGQGWRYYASRWARYDEHQILSF